MRTVFSLIYVIIRKKKRKKHRQLWACSRSQISAFEMQNSDYIKPKVKRFIWTTEEKSHSLILFYIHTAGATEHFFKIGGKKKRSIQYIWVVFTRCYVHICKLWILRTPACNLCCPIVLREGQAKSKGRAGFFFVLHTDCWRDPVNRILHSLKPRWQQCP